MNKYTKTKKKLISSMSFFLTHFHKSCYDSY